jgi:hypothetical protein
VTVWLAAFALVAGTAAFGVRMWSKRPSYVRQRHEDHENVLAAMEAWTRDRRIVKAAFEAGCLTPQGLRQMRRTMGYLSYPVLLATTCRFLQSRDVRKMAAKNMEDNGVDKRDAMAMLGWLAEQGRIH